MTRYREAGVDQDAADALVPRLAEHARRTRRAEVRGDLGGFAALVSLEDLHARGYRRPALVLATDGVGTKVELLRRAGLHRTAGWDCVAMCVDDLVCCGAEPLAFTDYVAIERLEADVVEEVVAGVADGCAACGCALVGGETAQHPGVLPSGAYDVSGTCAGLVDLDHLWGPHLVVEGDDVVGLASSGLHANGFSLVRRILEAGAEPPPDLLAPTTIYAPALLAAAKKVEVHAAAHVTGGGLAPNLARVLPPPLGARITLEAVERSPVFGWLARQGVDEAEIRRTFNAGVGMAVVTPDGGRAVEVFAELGQRAWVIGRVTGEQGVSLSPQV